MYVCGVVLYNICFVVLGTVEKEEEDEKARKQEDDLK